MCLHGPTKSTPLGVGSIVVTSLIVLSGVEGGLELRKLAISLFLFITAPVSAHMIAKTAFKMSERRGGKR